MYAADRKGRRKPASRNGRSWKDCGTTDTRPAIDIQVDPEKANRRRVFTSDVIQPLEQIALSNNARRKQVGNLAIRQPDSVRFARLRGQGRPAGKRRASYLMKPTAFLNVKIRTKGNGEIPLSEIATINIAAGDSVYSLNRTRKMNRTVRTHVRYSHSGMMAGPQHPDHTRMCLCHSPWKLTDARFPCNAMTLTLEKTVHQTPGLRSTMKFTFPPESKPLDGYTIKRAIHRGGFGEVYYAHSDAGKEVALKLLQQNLEIELRGVRQCMNLKHPNLVTIFDIRTDADGDHWIVMEYVHGKSLDRIIDEADGQPLSMDEIGKLLAGMVAGLSFLHDRGIVHRDLKPANVFQENGVVKIGDVGLAKFITQSKRSAQTESVGTVYYMAPEVARGRYGHEVDVYSLGIVLYEMLTGRVPFDGESTAEILMKHLSERPDLTPLPKRLRPVLSNALEKDPLKRTASVDQLLAEFRKAVAGVEIATTIPEDSFQRVAAVVPAVQAVQAGPVVPMQTLDRRAERHAQHCGPPRRPRPAQSRASFAVLWCERRRPPTRCRDAGRGRHADPDQSAFFRPLVPMAEIRCDCGHCHGVRHADVVCRPDPRRRESGAAAGAGLPDLSGLL